MDIHGPNIVGEITGANVGGALIPQITDLYSNSELCVTGMNNVVNLNGTSDTVRVTAYDLIRSVHGGSTSLPLTYMMSKNNVDWTSNTDPFACYLEFNCDDLGGLPVYVKVEDGTNNGQPVVAYITVQDNGVICP